MYIAIYSMYVCNYIHIHIRIIAMHIRMCVHFQIIMTKGVRRHFILEGLKRSCVES